MSHLCGCFGAWYACKKPVANPADSPNVVRIEGVNEPAELLVPGEKKLVHTEQMDALGNLIMSIKSGQEAAAISALGGFIDKYPRVGDTYSLRATLRCVTGDFQGAKADVEEGLSGLPRIFNDDPRSDRNQLLAIHAKLAFMAHDDADNVP